MWGKPWSIWENQPIPNHITWWRYQMETFSALLALCEGNPPVTNASDAELGCFHWSVPEQTVGQTIVTPVIRDAIALIITSLWWSTTKHDTFVCISHRIYFTRMLTCGRGQYIPPCRHSLRKLFNNPGVISWGQHSTSDTMTHIAVVVSFLIKYGMLTHNKQLNVTNLAPSTEW